MKKNKTKSIETIEPLVYLIDPASKTVSPMDANIDIFETAEIVSVGKDERLYVEEASSKRQPAFRFRKLPGRFYGKAQFEGHTPIKIVESQISFIG